LHVGESLKSFTNNKQAILLRAFSIDNKSQGKGFAKQAMSLLPRFVIQHFKEINEIVLAVNMKNEVVKKLYIGAGFVNKGIKIEGSIGMQHILHYDLD
jgi:RimJ/RimL family protein N-acetyltransferase